MKIAFDERDLRATDKLIRKLFMLENGEKRLALAAALAEARIVGQLEASGCRLIPHQGKVV